MLSSGWCFWLEVESYVAGRGGESGKDKLKVWVSVLDG